jgi:hypothetical protein
MSGGGVTVIEDLNRRLAELTAPLWFTATVQDIPPDEKDIPPREREILFQAITWRGNERLEHTAAYPITDIESVGHDVIASRFVEAARQALPRGTRSPV